jgi:hypothetical protein
MRLRQSLCVLGNAVKGFPSKEMNRHSVFRFNDRRTLILATLERKQVMLPGGGQEQGLFRWLCGESSTKTPAKDSDYCVNVQGEIAEEGLEESVALQVLTAIDDQLNVLGEQTA